MTALQDAARLYSWAEGVTNPRYAPDRTIVEDPPGTRFTQALTTLRRHLGESMPAPVWQPVLDAARALRWRAAVEPMPMQAPPSGAARALQELVTSSAAVRQAVSDESASLLDALVRSATAMGNQAEDPLSGAVGSALEVSDPANTCLVLVNRRAALLTQQWLAERWPGFACSAPREFLDGRLWDEAVVVGAAAWFPPELFTAPRAGHLELIVRSWIRDLPDVTGALGDLADQPLTVSFRDRREGTPEQEPDQRVAAEIMVPTPQWSPEPEPDPHTPEVLEARQILLGGGYSVYLELSADRIRGLDPALAPGERVIRLSATAIGPGRILLLRLGDTERVALKAVADQILGPERVRARALQDTWKRQLRDAVLRDGRERISHQLFSHGARTANIGYWISPDSIRPRSDRDFRAVLALIGIDDPEPYLKAGQALWRAHLRAGQQLTEELEQRLDQADLTPLDTEGMLDLKLELAGVASMTAFRVLAISPHIQWVHPHRLRVPIAAPEARWLE